MKQTEMAWHPILEDLADYEIAPFDGRFYPISAGNPVVNPGAQEWVQARWHQGYWQVNGGGAYMGARFWFNLPSAPVKQAHRRYREHA
jgi:hypothetical protein